MPIEFNCPRCGVLLSVPAGTGGQIAQCPNCQNETQIPSQSSAERTPTPRAVDVAKSHADGTLPKPSLPPTLSPRSAFDDANPYAAPLENAPPPTPIGSDGGIRASKLRVGETITLTWQAISQRPGQTLLLFLVSWGLVAVAAGLIVPVVWLGGLAAEQGDVGVILFPIITLPWVYSVTLIVGATLIRYSLNLALLGDLQLADIRRMPRLIPRLLAILFSIGALSLVGFLALSVLIGILAVAVIQLGFLDEGDIGLWVTFTTVGGVIWLGWGAIAIRLMFSFPFAVDQDTGILPSIEHSWRFTRGNWLMLLLSWIGLLIGAMLLTVVTFSIGNLVIAPLLVLVFTIQYLQLSGQLPRSELTGALDGVGEPGGDTDGDGDVAPTFEA